MKLLIQCSLMTAVLVFFCHHSFAQTSSKSYVCTPCGSSCDTKIYTDTGTCPRCKMPLVDNQTVNFPNITPDQVCQLIKQNPKIVLLDVRTAEEFEGTAIKSYGHLKNALNIPIQELEHRLGELAAFKNHEIIVYCSHSHRSPQVSHLLSTKGFRHVKNLLGGMSVWLNTVTDLEMSKEIFIKH